MRCSLRVALVPFGAQTPLILTPPFLGGGQTVACATRQTNEEEEQIQMTQLHAQPYDLSASGFYFESFEEFTEKSSNHRNMFGQSVEEYQIQFIDGEAIDCALAESVGINQVNIQKFIEISDLWSEDDKLRYVLAVGECGYAFDLDFRRSERAGC